MDYDFKTIQENKRAGKRINRLLEEIENYKRKGQYEEEGRHKTGIWCDGCKNLLTRKYNNPVWGECVDRFCKLDCKCEDRSEE